MGAFLGRGQAESNAGVFGDAFVGFQCCFIGGGLRKQAIALTTEQDCIGDGGAAGGWSKPLKRSGKGTLFESIVETWHKLIVILCTKHTVIHIFDCPRLLPFPSTSSHSSQVIRLSSLIIVFLSRCPE